MTHTEPTKRLAVDVLIFQMRQNPHHTHEVLHIMLLRRTSDPFKGDLALVGAAVQGDTVLTTVKNALRQKAKIGESDLANLHIEQLATYDDGDIEQGGWFESAYQGSTSTSPSTSPSPTRDPRNSVVSVAHIAILPPQARVSAPENGGWFQVEMSRIGPYEQFILTEATGNFTAYEYHKEKRDYHFKEGEILAFDHGRMIHEAIHRIAGKLSYTDLLFKFLPPTFTISAMQNVMEQFTGQRDPHFRRKYAHLIEETNEELRGKANRPAKLYKRRTDEKV